MAVANEDVNKEEKRENGSKRDEQHEEEEDLSEEDRELKENLELLVTRAQDKKLEIAKAALQAIASEIRSATSSMTSVPKPLKFLRGHYAGLKEYYRSLKKKSEIRGMLADIISFLAMTSSEKDSMETLKFRLASGNHDIAMWGHEYIRHLSSEIGDEYMRRISEDVIEDLTDLMDLVEKIVPWNMAHNAEPEAVDLCLEVDRLDLVEKHVDLTNCDRTCLYLLSCCSYLPEPDDQNSMLCAYRCFMSLRLYTNALRVSLRIGDVDLMAQAMANSDDNVEKKQIAYILGDCRIWIDFLDEEVADDPSVVEELQAIMGNMRLSERYLALARDLDVMEAKTPDDVYKSHLIEGRPSALDSVSANIAATYVNAFVNAGFGHDKLVTVEVEEEGSDAGNSLHWIFRNKGNGKFAAAASLGMIFLWDVEGGLPQVDRYLYASDSLVVGGALLAFGIIASGVADEVDPALAVLSEYVLNQDPSIKMGATWGLGIAYAGKSKTELKQILLPSIGDLDISIEQAALSALSVSLSYVGTSKGEIVEAILQNLMLRGESELDTIHGKIMSLALGLLFLGRKEAVEATIEVARTLPERISKYTCSLLDMCAYAFTGNVLKVQEFLSICGEQIEADEGNEGWQTAHQGISALAIGLVACGEELGSQMAHRALEHVLQYGGSAARKGVPLALAALNISNPDVAVIDILGRLSHDADDQVAMSAILSLGLVGAGTNNSRLAGLLRNLSMYYSKDSSMLFMVRISQGLVHSGKGLVSLSPRLASSGAILQTSIAGILITLTLSLDMKASLAGQMHYLLYSLVPAMRPRMLMTVDEDGAVLPVPVRVGQAVDVVAQAGKPKTVTGFQTHTTPVLLAEGERAELGTEKYIPMSPSLEGIVILRKNPDYIEVAE